MLNLNVRKMNTPLQNGLGHVFGPGKTAQTDGMFPVWLEQDGSRIMGGIINLQHEYKSGLKVVDVYPSSIRTATPCYMNAVGSYIPVPTFRVVAELTAEGTSLELANWDGCAKLIKGMVLVNPANDKTVTVSTISSTTEGNYKVTISADALGAMAVGDALVLQEAASWDVAGLTKSNLDYYGADPSSKLNITLVDRGRLLEGTAPALPKAMKEKLQTVKYEVI